MQLLCLGSGSSGNCYLLRNDNEVLVIEAGVSFKEVKKALDFNIQKIVGVVVSHSHGDHAKYASEYAAEGISVFKPYAAARNWAMCALGNFIIKSFDLIHDVPCCGVLIEHPDMGRFLYASDTEYIKYRFSRLNHILVEANYSSEFLERDAVNLHHVLKGHMELKTTLDFLKVNNNPELRNVILCHLSRKNSDPELFQNETKKIVRCDVLVAERGIKADMSLVPF